MSSHRRVSRDQARALLDFAGRPDACSLSTQLVDQQLDGAVAAHNLLQSVGVAYIADEVGTGKTLVAAGALALLRHHDPGLRALVITPRGNLQDNWQRELRSFARHNVRYPDLRVRGLGGEPVRSPRVVSGLQSLLAVWGEEPECDVIARLSSFQLGHRQRTAQEREAYVDDWRPLLAASGSRSAVSRRLDAAARGRGGANVKEAIAACLNRLLPDIGVLVMDEAHNLKGGVEPLGAARNRVLWTMLGYNAEFQGSLPGYGPRVERVMMLSATPMEDDTEQLLRQLQVLGVEGRVPLLAAEDEQTRLGCLRTFLFRRLTKLRVGDDVLTRNRYRQEWRLGGTVDANEALPFDDVRARLTFAVVQKKVADALNTGGGGRHFQIGMLTSFESLAESTRHARLPQTPDGGPLDDLDTPFDGTEQIRTASEDERRGIDEDGVGDLVKSHREEFGRPPNHPKMDAVVERLVTGARQGRKALVFTRRVASVDEIVQRVNDGLDADLEQRLRQELPGLGGELDRLFAQYDERLSGPVDRAPSVPPDPTIDLSEGDPDLADDESPDAPEADVLVETTPDIEATEDLRGGTSLFEWLFRSSREPALLTGYWLRQRLEQQSGGYVTLLRDNHVAAVLSCDPAEVMDRLAAAVAGRVDSAALVDELAQRYLGAAVQPSTMTRFRAAQLAGLHVLDQHGTGRVRSLAASALLVLAPTIPSGSIRRDRPVSVVDRLTEVTLATALRSQPDLCGELWHPELPGSWASEEEFQEREWRWRLFTTAVRLDFPAIDLWLAEVRRRGTLAPTDGRLDGPALIADFLQALRRQREEPVDVWTSYAALRALATDAALVLAVNGVQQSQDTVPAWVHNRVPALGMSGRINKTAVQQFRTPTYPLVLISTDLLQEGENLHTFCDEVHHYGIAWMPSSLEQRTGRVDRVNSLTERRLSRADVTLDDEGRPPADHRLNVLYPFISGTYEQLQVRRVLDRVDKHIRLLHESFGHQVAVPPRIDVDQEVADDSPMPQPVTNLGEPYPIDPTWLGPGRSRFPVVDTSAADGAERRFRELIERTAWGGCPVDWLTQTPRLHLLGECRLGDRVQPLDLRLTTVHGRAAVRIVSPVGLLPPDQLDELVMGPPHVYDARIGVVRVGPRQRRTFSVTVEDLVLVPQSADLGRFLERRVVSVLSQADELERALFSADRPLTDFAADLKAEMPGG